MRKLYLAIILGCLAIAFPAKADLNPANCGNPSKFLFWTGEQDNDFFNESNWREVNQKPSAPTPPQNSSGKQSYRSKMILLFSEIKNL